MFHPADTIHPHAGYRAEWATFLLNLWVCDTKTSEENLMGGSYETSETSSQLDTDLYTSQQKHSHTQVLAVAQQHAANVCLLTTWAAERGALVELCFLSERTLQKRNCWKWKCFKATAAERSTTYCCTQRQQQFDDIFWPHHKKNSRILNSGIRLALFLMKWWIPFSFLTPKHTQKKVFFGPKIHSNTRIIGQRNRPDAV